MHINRIINERGEFTTDKAEIWRKIKDYYEHLYTNKSNNLDEMDNFLEMCIHLKLGNEGIKSQKYKQ